MPYTPPANNAVDFELVVHTIPANNAVDFEFEPAAPGGNLFVKLAAEGGLAGKGGLAGDGGGLAG